MSVKREGKLFTGNPSRAFQRAARRTSDRALRVTRDKSRVKTGRMRSGWQAQITGNSSGVSLTISNNVPYTIFQERGTKYVAPMLAAAAGLETATAIFQQELQHELTGELGGYIQSLASSRNSVSGLGVKR